MNNIGSEINLAIQNIDSILEKEDFSAYHQVRKSLEFASELIKAENYIEAKKPLLLSIRLLMEAPTKDKDLGLDTLKKVDAVYKKVASLTK